MNRSNLTEYYARRASEFEQVYQDPERQGDLQQMAEWVGEAFSGLKVLEVACGTGYWTQYRARSARCILATDFNTEMLDIARKKDFGTYPVSFLKADAYDLPTPLPGQMPNAGFHGFWWSHVPIQRRAEFLQGFHAHLAPGSPVVLLENRYVAGKSTPITRQDASGNTYQQRKLQDGTPFEVLKNFQTPPELQSSLLTFARHLEIIELKFYWMARYTIADLPNQTDL